MFTLARKKLTAWYLVILMSVSISFSIVIYRGMTAEIDRFSQIQRMRIERRFDEAGIPHPPLILDAEIIYEVKQHVILNFLIVNSVIFIVMGGLSYFLAGKTLRPIQEMMEEQNRFVSDASHELKTPLTAMKSALEVYARDPKLTLNEARQVLKDNIHEVDRLQNLSESLLTLSENQSNIGVTYFSPILLNECIAKAYKQVKYSAHKKNIEVHISAVPHTKIHGNEEKLIELFTILMDNAIKYSEEKTIISISGISEKKGLLIRVSDKGMGISEKDLPHIFDRFYRSDIARSREGVGGYGLGLPIAKKIVEMHKGEIKIESVVHFGTVVSVWLPTN